MELKLRGQKWLINCSNKPCKTLLGELLKLLIKNQSLQFSKYECFVFISDFNVRMENKGMKDLCNL